MRKLTSLFALLAALAVAGCGSSDAGDASKPVPPGAASSNPNVAGNTSVAQ